MKKQRYTLDDLLLELRNNGISNIFDVEYAVLERTGNLNIFKFDNNTFFPLPIILDSVINYEVLKLIGKNKKWLNDYLKEEDININNVFYCFYKNEKLYFIFKNELKY